MNRHEFAAKYGIEYQAVLQASYTIPHTEPYKRANDFDEADLARAEELEALRRELEAARRDLDDATDAAEAAEHRAANANAELAALKAGADPARKAISVQLGEAVGEFMRVCSTMPYCAEELMQERGAVIGILSDLEGWLERMFAAVGQSETVTGEGAVE